MQFWFVTVPKYSYFASSLKDLVAISKFWFCPELWWWDTTIYLVFSVFNSRQTSLLASNRASVFFFIVFMFLPHTTSSSHDSSVSIALGYGLDNWGTRVWFLEGAGNFSLHHHVQNGSGAHPDSYPVGTRGSFLGGKVARAWSWPLTPI
jgi:hypothetical protein